METTVVKITSEKIVRIGQKIDYEKISARSFDVHELFNAINSVQIVLSWGAHNWTFLKDTVLIFKVNGHHHKGTVAITLNWDDTFIVYYAGLDGIIKMIDVNVYIDQLIDIIDVRVEKIDTYTF